MTKVSPSNDRPEHTDSTWIRDLAAPAETTGTAPRPYYGALAASAQARDAAAASAHTGAHRLPEPRVETAPAATTTGPIPRLSADQIDRLIHRLDRDVEPVAVTETAVAPEIETDEIETDSETETETDIETETETDGETAVDAAAPGASSSEWQHAATESVDTAAAIPQPSAHDVQISGTVPPPPAGPAKTAGGNARIRARKPLLVLAAAALCAVTVGGGTVAAMDKTVSVVVDGAAHQVTTMSGSVSGALAAAGISPGAHDAVAPDVHAAISDGSTIVVDRGRLLTLTVDGQQRQIWTTARTVDEALTQLGTGPDLSLSANRSRQIPLDGLAVTASSLRTVRVAVGGAPATSTTSAATTVGTLLAAQHVSVAATDRVTPGVTTPLTDGLLVTVDKVAVTVKVVTHALPQPAAKTVADAALAKGTVKVVQRGKAGSESISYQVTTVNGRQTSQREVARKTVVAPVGTVNHAGTKVAVVAPPKPVVPKSTFTYSGSEVFTNDTSFGVNWDGLAMCESTHNPKAINANPSAGLPTYGMFQFDLPTWASVGGSGNPIDASPEEQLMRAKLLYQSRGLEPWACRDAAH